MHILKVKVEILEFLLHMCSSQMRLLNCWLGHKLEFSSETEVLGHLGDGNLFKFGFK